MNYESAEKALRGRWEARWTGETREANAPSRQVPDADSWARLSIMESESRQRSLGPIGARNTRRFGLMACELYVKAGTGTQLQTRKMDEATGIFEMTTFSGITCGPARIVRRGLQGAWDRADVFFDFYWDVTN